MAVVSSCCCDQCGADITKGDGRQWRLMLMSEVIGMKQGSEPRHDQGSILNQQHFCNESCLAAWAASAGSEKDKAEAKYREDLTAKAAASEKRPGPSA